MKLVTKSHTILVMVGPTACGKTYTCLNKLPRTPNIAYISSDDCRRELLNDTKADKYGTRMLEISEAAFHLLYTRLDCLTRWPVKTQIVVVDSTGLNAEFRAKLNEIAEKNHYNLEYVVFDYKSYAEYMVSPDGDKTLISKHVQRLRNEVLPNLGAKRHTIRTRDTTIEFEIADDALYQSSFLNPQREYFIVGDVHACLLELQQLLEKAGFTLSEDGVLQGKDATDVILAGDFMDKGPDEPGLLAFIERNPRILLVQGNHDWQCRDRLSPALMERMKSFYIFRALGKAKSFVVTHAPCEAKYLGKLSGESRKKQSYLYAEYPHVALPAGDWSWPYHVFGHITYETMLRHENFIGLDTGCVAGNRLTGVFLGGSRDRPFVQSVVSTLPRSHLPKDQVRFAESPAQSMDRSANLGPREMKRLGILVRDQVRFISGTVAPAPSVAGDLESQEACLRYFEERFKTSSVQNWSVSVEKKWMGSRANLYLNRDGSTYAVSRKGFKITHIDLKNASRAQYERLLPLMEERKITQLLLDCELMPWSVLGKGLIEEEFGTVGIALKAEQSALIEAGVDVSAQVPMVASYLRQLELYGKESVPHFKPFSILKIVYDDGRVELPVGQIETYKLVGEDPSLVLDLHDMTGSILQLSHFFKEIVGQGYEGVVVKPDIAPKGCAPFMKIRNREYLSIIYGFDYLEPSKYENLIKKKNISKKLKISIEEAELGRQMLVAPVDKLRGLFTKFLYAEEAEKKVDSRL
jgi:predicted kinase